MLGHIRLDTTDRYTLYIDFKPEEFVIKTAKTLQEALDLANAGFDLWDEFDSVKIYRKRK